MQPDGHHVWPKFMGGPHVQALLAVRSPLHLGVLHPALVPFLQARGHDITGRTTDNGAFIQRLRDDAAFRRRVARDLRAFYRLVNTVTSPPMPAAAYERGIDHTLSHLAST
jgi:hypothetical protein